MRRFSLKFAAVVVQAVVAISLVGPAQAADEAAARALARQSNCFKCHNVDKVKEGPSFKVTAAKYAGKAGAQDTLLKHITTGPKVKFEDGHEEEHTIVKSKDDKEIRNLIDWILSVK